MLEARIARLRCTIAVPALLSVQSPLLSAVLLSARRLTPDVTLDASLSASMHLLARWPHARIVPIQAALSSIDFNFIVRRITGMSGPRLKT